MKTKLYVAYYAGESGKDINISWHMSTKQIPKFCYEVPVTEKQKERVSNAYKEYASVQRFLTKKLERAGLAGRVIAP